MVMYESDVITGILPPINAVVESYWLVCRPQSEVVGKFYIIIAGADTFPLRVNMKKYEVHVRTREPRTLLCPHQKRDAVDRKVHNTAALFCSSLRNAV